MSISKIPPYLPVAKAVIIDRNRALCLHKATRGVPHATLGFWDFPGGRMEPGEVIIDCLHREVFEETNFRIDVHTSICGYDVIQDDAHLVIIKFLCTNPRGELKLSDEHDDYIWVSADELDGCDLPTSMKNEIKRAFYLQKLEE